MGLEFGKSQRAVENREKWRKLVAKSSVVPQRPSWSRDRGDETREVKARTPVGQPVPDAKYKHLKTIQM